MAVRCSVESLSCLLFSLQVDTMIYETTHKIDLRAILVFDDGSAGVDLGTVDNQLAHLVKVGRRDGFRERELARKDGRDTNLVRFDIDVGRDDRARSIVYSLSLQCK